MLFLSKWCYSLQEQRRHAWRGVGNDQATAFAAGHGCRVRQVAGTVQRGRFLPPVWQALHGNTLLNSDESVLFTKEIAVIDDLQLHLLECT